MECAHSDGGVLGGREQCLAVLAELAVQHGPGVSQQRGEDLSSGNLQNLGWGVGGFTQLDFKHEQPCTLTSL